MLIFYDEKEKRPYPRPAPFPVSIKNTAAALSSRSPRCGPSIAPGEQVLFPDAARRGRAGAARTRRRRSRTPSERATGFLRDPNNNYTRELTDPFVPGSMIEKYGLREGIYVKGLVQGPRRNQGPRIREITEVEGAPPEEYIKVKSFDEKTPINPEYWLRLEVGAEPLSNRVMDLLTPLGKGQRALIVSPPRSGKTMLLQNISMGVSNELPGRQAHRSLN